MKKGKKKGRQFSLTSPELNRIMTYNYTNSTKKFQEKQVCFNRQVSETAKSQNFNNCYNDDIASIHGRFMDVFLTNSGMPDDFATKQIIQGILFKEIQHGGCTRSHKGFAKVAKCKTRKATYRLKNLRDTNTIIVHRRSISESNITTLNIELLKDHPDLIEYYQHIVSQKRLDLFTEKGLKIDAQKRKKNKISEHLSSPDNTEPPEPSLGSQNAHKSIKHSFINKSNIYKNNSFEKKCVLRTVEESEILTRDLIEDFKRRFSMDAHTVYEYFEQLIEFIKVLEAKSGKRRTFTAFQWREYFLKFCRRERELKQKKVHLYIPPYKRAKYKLNLDNTPLSANQTERNMVQYSEVHDIFSRGVSPVITVDQLTKIPAPEVVEKDTSFRGRYGTFEGIRDLNDPTDPKNVNYKQTRTEEEQQEMDGLLAKYYPQLVGITKKE